MIVITFMWKNCYFCQFWGDENDENALKWRFKAQNGSKMGQKWPKFSFFSAEMTGTQVKSVKIVDS